MRRIVLLTVVFLAAAAFGLAVDTARAGMSGKSMVMEGYVIDTKCATANEATLDTFAPTHPKSCALACAATGYNLYSGGKLWKFDKASSDKVHEFLKKSDSKTHVSVEMEHLKGNEIKLISIKNAK
jgi:hypothetical protein